MSGRDVIAAREPGTYLLLGNTAVVEKFRDRRDEKVKKRKRPDLRNRVTEVHFPEGITLVDAVKNVVDLWPWHSDADGPEWVHSDDDLLARAVAEHFTKDGHVCTVGRPADWREG